MTNVIPAEHQHVSAVSLHADVLAEITAAVPQRSLTGLLVWLQILLLVVALANISTAYNDTVLNKKSAETCGERCSFAP